MTETGSIARWIDCHARFTPAKPALAVPGRDPVTYGRLSHWSRGIAATLRDVHGIRRGDRVCYLGFNHPEMVALLFACARIGAIAVPMNWRLADAELAYVISDCTPGLLVCDDSHRETARNIAGSLPVATHDDLEGTPLTAGQGTDEGGTDEGGTDDAILIVYTSGTTGRPKGAVHTQRSLFFNALNSLHMHAMHASDVILTVLPLFHVGGLNIQLTPALYCGATVLLHERFEPGATLDAIVADRPSLTVLVPATMEAIMREPGWADADLSSLRMLSTGSSVVPTGLISAFEARGVPVVQVYGATETCPIAVYQQPGEGRTHPLSTGKTGLHCSVRLTDGRGQSVEGADKDGQIEVRGPNVMSGYWRKPDETAAVLRDGWFATGDIGQFDPDGYLYFQDRINRVIISGGENIYAAEVERVLNGVEGIAECCVVGRPDDRWGEVPVAAIVLAGDTEIDEAFIRSRLDREIARFKHPKSFYFMDNLPRNAMGKIVPERVSDMISASPDPV